MDSVYLSLHQSYMQFCDSVKSFPDSYFHERLNQRWSAAQIAEHIIKAGSLIHLLQGDIVVVDREPDLYVPVIKKVFLDFQKRYPSEERLIPSEAGIDKLTALDELAEHSISFQEFVQQHDLHQTVKGFEFPDVGQLTRLEVLWMHSFHIQRHYHQIQILYSELASLV